MPLESQHGIINIEWVNLWNSEMEFNTDRIRYPAVINPSDGCLDANLCPTWIKLHVKKLIPSVDIKRKEAIYDFFAPQEADKVEKATNKKRKYKPSVTVRMKKDVLLDAPFLTVFTRGM